MGMMKSVKIVTLAVATYYVSDKGDIDALRDSCPPGRDEGDEKTREDVVASLVQLTEHGYAILEPWSDQTAHT